MFHSQISEDFSQIFRLINDLISKRVKRRLILYLINSVVDNSTVKKTHDEIARDIGTSRVVVSRLLKAFEKKGFITLKRGTIFINNLEKIEREAQCLPE